MGNQEVDATGFALGRAAMAGDIHYNKIIAARSFPQPLRFEMLDDIVPGGILIGKEPDIAGREVGILNQII